MTRLRTLGLAKRLARLHFFYHKFYFDFCQMNSIKLLRLKSKTETILHFSESICNAGLIRDGKHWIAVAKNQRLSLRLGRLSRFVGRSGVESRDDGRRVLYKVIIRDDWSVAEVINLKIKLDGVWLEEVEFVEDVRLFHLNGQIHVFANGPNAWPLIGVLEGERLILKSLKSSYSSPQKNWMPFVVDGGLYLEYSILPRCVLRCDAATGETTELEYPSRMPEDRDMQHRLSQLRYAIHGGAPAVRITEDLFLGVANSQHMYWFQDRYYAQVFYTFSARPPYNIRNISRPCRLLGAESRINYVSGVCMEPETGRLILSVGIDDDDNVFLSVSLGDALSAVESGLYESASAYNK